MAVENVDDTLADSTRRLESRKPMGCRVAGRTVGDDPTVKQASRIAAALALVLATALPCAHADAPPQRAESKVLWTRIAGVSVITLWGISEWQYFQRAPHADSEGWFEDSASHGGADKLGHLHFSHFLTQGVADLYELGIPAAVFGARGAY